MKPWLFDILACPIDKNYPLELVIFCYETDNSIFDSIFELYEKQAPKSIEEQKIIEIIEEQDQLLIKDNIVLKRKKMKEYLDLILSSINEMKCFIDKSTNQVAQKCLDLLLNDIYGKISDFKKKEIFHSIDEILPELVFVNRMKIEIEIESGILFCNKCNRWYPIIDTIPQMLPDEYRDKKKDLQFLKTNKNSLNQDFLNKDLKPFNI